MYNNLNQRIHLYHNRGIAISTSTGLWPCSVWTVINRRGEARFSSFRWISWLIRADREHSQELVYHDAEIEFWKPPTSVPGKITVQSLRLINSLVKLSDAQGLSDVLIKSLIDNLWKQLLWCESRFSSFTEVQKIIDQFSQIGA